MSLQAEAAFSPLTPETLTSSLDAAATKQLAKQREDELKADEEWRVKTDTLVLLPCLGAFKKDIQVPKGQTVTGDEKWCLWPFQKGETERYVDDMRQVTELTRIYQTALAVFSGGTRPDSGEWTEATTAYATAEQNDWLLNGESRIAAACDDTAYDSLTNVLGSLVKFYELTGHYPKKLVILGWDFKKQRFLDQHLSALRLNTIQVVYIGGHNPASDSGFVEGEATAISLFNKDPYGMKEELYKKKLARASADDLTHILDGYAAADPELQGLIDHMKNPDVNHSIYTGELPWDKNERVAPVVNYTPLPTSLAA